MKKLLMLAIVTIFMISCNGPGKDRFVVEGSIDTTLNDWIYLQMRNDGPLQTIDSVRSVNGKFTFSGTVKYPEMYYINVRATKSLIPFFVEPSKIRIVINTREINKTKITGSKTQTAYENYQDQLDRFDNQMREYYKLYQQAVEAGEQEKIDEYDSIQTILYEERGKFIKKYAYENNKSFISPFIVYRNSYDYDLNSLQKVLDNFGSSIDSSKYIGYLNDFLGVLKRTAVGQLYVSFMMQDTTGVYLPISSLIGEKYLLVDFWASWCGPCRAENPNLVTLYNEFKDQGFEILGVSFDSNRERWIKAIKDDHLDWYHVSDLKGWENKVGKLYGVRSIPANVLIDPNGYIIGKNLRGEELRTKLEEIFSRDS